jgi:hypothetical protein
MGDRMPEPLDRAPQRFTELPPDTRRFFRAMSGDDIKILHSLIRFCAMLQGWCRINRWLVYGALGVLFLLWQLAEPLRYLFDVIFKAKP